MSKKWWNKSIIYQIYPRSFKDSNGDGIGDIKGIIEKLDYIKELGADLIWLSPVYMSPVDDNGYDISDYCSIAPEFGTMEDMDNLISETKKRGIEILMDLVVNHTSDEHPWFIESKKSLDNKYRDYYIWRNPNFENKEPNSWPSFFTRSAWEFDKTTKQYYLHLFSKKQPDLNWENENVRNDIYKMMKWWLEKGISGFRMDAINMISKPESFAEGTPMKMGPRLHDFLHEMNKVVLSNYNIVTVGETPTATPAEGILFTGKDREELDMVFHFEHVEVDINKNKWDLIPFDLVKLKGIMAKWQDEIYEKGWNSLYWNNHDQARVVSRFGNDKEYRVKSAKMLATVLHFMYGTPFVFQGEEIGMTNIEFENIEQYDDIETINYFDAAINDYKLEYKDVMGIIHKKSRDNARTPMQWNNTVNAGFTRGNPWLSVNDNYTEINVEKALSDCNSIFYHYKKLISYRKKGYYSDAMVYGKHKLLLEEHKNLWAYTREYDNVKILIVANFGSSKQKVTLEYDVKSILISNYTDSGSDLNQLMLRPYEAVAYEI